MKLLIVKILNEKYIIYNVNIASNITESVVAYQKKLPN